VDVGPNTRSNFRSLSSTKPKELRRWRSCDTRVYPPKGEMDKYRMKLGTNDPKTIVDGPKGTYLHLRLIAAIALVSSTLTACDGLFPLVYNLTPCPITVTYSAANIRDHKVLVDPGHEVGGIGGFSAPRVENLIIVDNDNQTHAYSSDDLSRLRPRMRGPELWGYYDDGLRFLDKTASLSPPDPGSRSCRATAGR